MKVTYCIVHLNRLANLQKALRLHAPHCDKTIVVDGGSTDGSLEWLNSDECKAMNVNTIVHTWNDDPPGSRNVYLKAAGHEGFLLILDDDEYLEEPAIWSIKQIAQKAADSNCSSVSFLAHDIQTAENGTVWENCSNYKNSTILVKAGPKLKYVGETHVSLQKESGGILDSGFKYFHIKTVMDQYLRACRNAFTTAAPAQNSKTGEWLQFKDLCKKNNLKLFSDLAALMKSGTVPKDLADWFIRWKDHSNAEFRSYFICYFVYMHPELNPGISNNEFPYDSNRKPITGMTY